MAASAAIPHRIDAAAELRNTSTLIANETLNDLLLASTEEGVVGSGVYVPKTTDSGDDTENTVGILHQESDI